MPFPVTRQALAYVQGSEFKSTDDAGLWRVQSCNTAFAENTVRNPAPQSQHVKTMTTICPETWRNFAILVWMLFPALFFLLASPSSLQQIAVEAQGHVGISARLIETG